MVDFYFRVLRDPNPDPNGTGGGGSGGGAVTAEQINALQGDAFRSVLPEDIRDAGWMKDVNTFGDFVKKAAGAQVLIGQGAVPPDDAKPEQWNAWFEKIGRPSKAEEYGIPEVQGVPKEYIEKVAEVGTLQKILHAAGLNKMMGKTAIANIIKTTYDAEQAELKAAEAAHEKLMNDTFGKDRQSITVNGKKYLAEALPANVAPFLNQLDDKQLAIVLAITDSVAKKFGQEDAFRGGKGAGGGGGGETMETLRAQMRDIMGQKEYQDPFINKTKHAELSAKMEEIRGKMRKIQPV